MIESSSNVNLVDADTAPTSLNGYVNTSNTVLYPSGSTLGWSYPYPVVQTTNVRKAKNGFVVEHNYELYVAKTEKELSKLLTSLFSNKKPNK